MCYNKRMGKGKFVGRPQVYETNADRQRAYRRRQGASDLVGRPPLTPVQYTDEWMAKFHNAWDAHRWHSIYYNKAVRNTLQTLARRDRKFNLMELNLVTILERVSP